MSGGAYMYTPLHCDFPETMQYHALSPVRNGVRVSYIIFETFSGAPLAAHHTTPRRAFRPQCDTIRTVMTRMSHIARTLLQRASCIWRGIASRSLVSWSNGNTTVFFILGATKHNCFLYSWRYVRRCQQCETLRYLCSACDIFLPPDLNQIWVLSTDFFYRSSQY